MYLFKRKTLILSHRWTCLGTDKKKGFWYFLPGLWGPNIPPSFPLPSSVSVQWTPFLLSGGVCITCSTLSCSGKLPLPLQGGISTTKSPHAERNPRQTPPVTQKAVGRERRTRLPLVFWDQNLKEPLVTSVDAFAAWCLMFKRRLFGKRRRLVEGSAMSRGSCHLCAQTIPRRVGGAVSPKGGTSPSDVCLMD